MFGSLSIILAMGKRGFEIVNDVAKAAAILSLIVAQGEIVLHGDENIPRKSIYQYQPALPDKKIIWKSKIQVEYYR
jgi:hypothetical protein